MSELLGTLPPTATLLEVKVTSPRVVSQAALTQRRLCRVLAWWGRVTCGDAGVGGGAQASLGVGSGGCCLCSRGRLCRVVQGSSLWGAQGRGGYRALKPGSEVRGVSLEP